MTLSRSVVRVAAGVGTTPTNLRHALAAFAGRAASGAFGVRPGSLWGCTVTGTAGWNYSVAAGSLITVRSTLQGAYPAAIDGATLVATDPAPASTSRIDIIYARQNDTEVGDADNLPVLGCAIGVASGSPVAPSIPAGAVELARNTMTSAATSTNSAGNTISHASAPITSLPGGFAEAPTVADLARIVSPLTGDVAKVTATGQMYSYASSQWREFDLATGALVQIGNGAVASGALTALGPAVSLTKGSPGFVRTSTGIQVPSAGWYDIFWNQVIGGATMTGAVRAFLEVTFNPAPSSGPTGTGGYRTANYPETSASAAFGAILAANTVVGLSAFQATGAARSYDGYLAVIRRPTPAGW